jgi:hypothetical protein
MLVSTSTNGVCLCSFTVGRLQLLLTLGEALLVQSSCDRRALCWGHSILGVCMLPFEGVGIALWAAAAAADF